MNQLLRDVAQRLVHSAKDVSCVFGKLKAGNGRASVSAEFDGRTQLRKMPHLNRESTFWQYLWTLMAELKCCPNLLANRRLTTNCDKCDSGSTPTPALVKVKPEPKFEPKFEPKTNSETVVNVVPLKRKSSSTEPEVKSAPVRMSLTVPTQPRPAKSPKAVATVTSNQQIFTTPPNKSAAVCAVQTVRVSAPTQSAPVVPMQTSPSQLQSSSQTPPLSSNPTEWTIDDVIRYLTLQEPNLEQHAETFRKHVSDTHTDHSRADAHSTLDSCRRSMAKHSSFSTVI